MPNRTREGDHGLVCRSPRPPLPPARAAAVGEPITTDGGDAEATLAQFDAAGINAAALAPTLQSDGARSFVQSWEHLLSQIDQQVAAVAA